MNSWRQTSPGWRATAAAILAKEAAAGQTTLPERHPARLPDDLREGVLSLRRLPWPEIEQSWRWRLLVEDAFRLATDGWAAQALGLGWHGLELFGCSQDDPHLDGLLVWLCGARMSLLDDKGAVAITDDGKRIRFWRKRGLDFSACLPVWDLAKPRPVIA